VREQPVGAGDLDHRLPGAHPHAVAQRPHPQLVALDRPPQAVEGDLGLDQPPHRLQVGVAAGQPRAAHLVAGVQVAGERPVGGGLVGGRAGAERQHRDRLVDAAGDHVVAALEHLHGDLGVGPLGREDAPGAVEVDRRAVAGAQLGHGQVEDPRRQPPVGAAQLRAGDRQRGGRLAGAHVRHVRHRRTGTGVLHARNGSASGAILPPPAAVAAAAGHR
jgi:hypothetical protein